MFYEENLGLWCAGSAGRHQAAVRKNALRGAEQTVPSSGGGKNASFVGNDSRNRRPVLAGTQSDTRGEGNDEFIDRVCVFLHAPQHHFGLATFGFILRVHAEARPALCSALWNVIPSIIRGA